MITKGLPVDLTLYCAYGYTLNVFSVADKNSMQHWVGSKDFPLDTFSQTAISIFGIFKITKIGLLKCSPLTKMLATGVKLYLASRRRTRTPLKAAVRFKKSTENGNCSLCGSIKWEMIERQAESQLLGLAAREHVMRLFIPF